jgi:UDP-glucuronate decarboxylase
MKVLVTGGAGFVGSHLCDRLLAMNYDVICVDNFSTGSKRNIIHLLSNPNFKLIQHDITFPLYLEVDGIFNLACPASPIHYQKDPIQTLKTSVLGAINMLGLAKRTGARILQASTSEIYGDPEISPQVEAYWGNVNPVGTRACYDEGKRAAETLFFDYHRQFKIDIRVARIFNSYGPRMAFNDGRVISNFIYQAISRNPLTIYGNGEQTRSFCYIEDLVDGLVQLFLTSDVYEPINLGNPHPKRILDLAQEILILTNSSSSLVYSALPLDDPKLREPDIKKAKEILNWIPRVAHQDGLLKTIEDFQDRLITFGGRIS